jgi:hypothetical protein
MPIMEVYTCALLSSWLGGMGKTYRKLRKQIPAYDEGLFPPDLYKYDNGTY